MKKYIIYVVMCMLFLSACSGEKSISGQVIDVNLETESGLTQFVILTEEEEQAVLQMDDETFVLSWVDGVDAEAFKDGQILDVEIVASYTDKEASKGSSGEKRELYFADEIRIHSVFEEDAQILQDGTQLDIWKQSDSISYHLKDGTELLIEQTPCGPHNSYVGGVDSLETMPEAAQEKVLAFYEGQGLLYQVPDELERAYQEYLTDSEEFSSYYISQSIRPSASNETVIWFLTSVMLPIDGKHGQEIRLGAAFGRETGEYISNFDLFACAKEDVLPHLLELAKFTDTDLQAEMEAVFQPEYIIFSPESVEIAFPAGTLPSQEHCYMIGIDINEELCEILNDWAVPRIAEFPL